ncbi:MAG: serine hydrolase [Candidatus Limnocylindrales bacterium]|jgi:hypothetical protein
MPLPWVDIDGGGCFNSPALHAVEIPAANGITTATSLARVFAATVSAIDGIQLFDAGSIKDALRVRSEVDGWAGAPPPDVRFSSGFMLHGSRTHPLLSDASFGHDGAGGELGFADADCRVGFGYVNNRMGSTEGRVEGLLLALRRSLGL